MASGGLGIAEFLKHGGDGGGGRGGWLREWRKNGKGEATIWLHTRAPIVPAFSHSFMLEDTYEDKETKKKTPTLRFPRFISPDPEIVTRNQFFRDNGILRTPPDRDPFLLLREWLRFADHLALEAPIFQWQHFKERKTIVWDRGEISGLVKRGKHNWNHSLDTKIEYIYIVVDHDDAAAGAVFAREGKLLSQKMVEVIGYQRKEFGEDQGDPCQHPYAFRWIADDSSGVPLNAYKCFKAEAAVCSDEIWNAIADDNHPDPVPLGEPGDGDMAKIRDAFKAAAQVDLPLDKIFSEDSEERRALCRPATRAPARSSKAAQQRSEAAPKPPAPTPRQPAAAAAQKPAPTTSGPQPRRKKVEPKVEPEVETIPCDDCGHQMLPTDSKCGGCGTEYEIDEASAPTLPPKKPAQAPATAATRPKPGPPTKQAPVEETPGDEPVAGPTNCWSCQADLTAVERDSKGILLCANCGLDQGDDIPF